MIDDARREGTKEQMIRRGRVVVGGRLGIIHGTVNQQKTPSGRAVPATAVLQLGLLLTRNRKA